MTPSCGVAQLADSESSTDWGGTGPNNALPFYGISYQAAGPLSSQAITTDGSSGWIETSTEYTNPESFTVLVWFKTTTANGAILGFSSLQDPWSPTYADRMLWVDPAGKLVWGVYGTADDEIKTVAAVDTGSWVFAAASVGAAGASLDVNGTVVTNAAYTTARNYPGWWTMAWAYLSGWADTPSSDYFNGALAQLAIIPSQLSPGQVSTIYGESSQSAYAAQINTLSPVNYWPFTDTGSVPYPNAPPGTQDLVDSSGHSNTGTAVGGVTVGAAGPTTLAGSSGLSLDGSTGYVETTTSYTNPGGFSIVAWFKTTSSSGGTIIGFDSSVDTSTPTDSDRLLWMDNTGHLVWGIDDAGVKDEITSPSVYNTGLWFMVTVEEGAAPGARLYVNAAQVATNAAYTIPQNYTGYWHVGWGYETGWADAPTSSYFNGSLSEVAYLPSVLSGTQLSTLYGETSVSTLSTYMMSLGPDSYWTLQDSATSICGTTEITVQEKLGATSTCIYPAEPVGTACPVVSASYMLTALGSRSSTVVPIAGSPVTVTVTMKLSAASGVLVAGLHMLPDIALGTQYSTTLWSAGVSYPYASVEL